LDGVAGNKREKNMAIKIISFLILFLGIQTLAVAGDSNNMAEQETIKLRIKELELRKQVLELEAQKVQQPQSQSQPQSYRQPSGQLQNMVPSSSSASRSSGYIRGPRGGCYTFSSSGRKHYVDRSMCD